MPSPGSTLASVRLFASFTAEERDTIAARGHMQEAPSGTLLIREGEKADAMFALLSGSIRVLRRGAGGHDVVIATLGPGECFGEIALLDGDQRSATIMTTETCRYFTLRHDAFWDLAGPSPPLLRKLLAELSQKMRDTSGRLAHAELEARMLAAEGEVRRHRTIAHAVTGLAHEINTPLGICVSLTSFLEGWMARAPQNVAADLEEPVGIISDNLRRVVSLMQEFHALAADQHGDQLVSADLRELLDECRGNFAEERPDRTLSVSVAGAPSPWRGYGAAIQRVVMELLANAAVHAYPAGGGPVEILLAGDRLQDRPAYRVEVRDRGAGIPPDHRHKLFDPFFTTARGSGHKGLGLTVAYNAVTGPLGGTFTLESEPGAGTTVTLLIPQHPPPRDAAG